MINVVNIHDALLASPLLRTSCRHSPAPENPRAEQLRLPSGNFEERPSLLPPRASPCSADHLSAPMKPSRAAQRYRSIRRNAGQHYLYQESLLLG